MGIEFDLVLYALSLALLGIFSGACTALEILSLSTSDRSAEDDDDDSEYIDRILEDPIRNGIALNLAFILAAAFTIFTSIRVAYIYLFAGVEGAPFYVALFVVASLLVPCLITRVFAVRGAERFAAGTKAFTYSAAWVLRPFAIVAVAIVRRLSPGLTKLLVFRFIPLKQKIELFGAQNGDWPDEEQTLMSSVLDFGETRVREVMVPRIDIVAVNVETNVDDAVRTIIDAGHSRVPVFEETIDKILGTIYTKDVLRKVVDGEELSLTGLVREVFFVPESKMIDELLTEFQSRKLHMAIVVDEYGGTAGLVTLEDVLEEIVGDIQDEFDREEELVTRLDDDTAVCNAKIRLDELSDLLRISFPEDAPDSLGGLLYQMIGRVPRVGDKRSMDGIEFEIQSVERQRIDKVIVRGLSSVSGRYRDDTG